MTHAPTSVTHRVWVATCLLTSEGIIEAIIDNGRGNGGCFGLIHPFSSCIHAGSGGPLSILGVLLFGCLDIFESEGLYIMK